jgi:YidC/Oxa1 family membrane protein insertase
MVNLIITIKSIFEFFKLPDIFKKYVFFSEGSSYSNVFENIILKLIKNKVKVTYITSDKNDKILNLKNNYCKSFYISKTIGQILLLNNINCEYLFMTMPDLGNFHVKKSNYCKNYIYLFHSPVSTNMIYRNKAFINYDTILCVGEHHYLELKDYKDKYNLKNQKLIKFGYPKIDNLLKKHSENKNNYIKKKVSIAPSWGLKNLINIFNNEFYESLLSNNYILNLRPHSNIQKKDYRVLKSIIKKYKNNSSFKIENSNETFKEVFDSEYLITDWSGIGLEFAFITERPVIFIDTEKKINNMKYNDISHLPIEITLRDQIGIIVKLENIKYINKYLEEIDNKKKYFQNNILEARKKYIYNLGNSVEKIADVIPFSFS